MIFMSYMIYDIIGYYEHDYVVWLFNITYLIANPISKFMIIIETNKENNTNATWVVGVPFSSPSGMNKSPKLNSPTIIAKVHKSDVNGSLKWS